MVVVFFVGELLSLLTFGLCLALHWLLFHLMPPSEVVLCAV